ncbi:MAG: 50S ribosomal protein L10 [Anaerolineae bacterium]|nr:50S ribosomal protein L10 [Anaerolineae bacterium]
MAITRERKEELMAQYIDLLKQSDAVFIAEYKGLSVKKLQELRAEARKVGGVVYVTKNTLLLKALAEVGMAVPEAQMNGQLATSFSLGDAPSVAKTLLDFAKKEDLLTVKGGVLGPKFLTVQEVDALSKLPTMDQLRAQLVGVISAPARNVASIIAGGVRQVVNVLDAYTRKDESAEAAA